LVVLGCGAIAAPNAAAADAASAARTRYARVLRACAAPTRAHAACAALVREVALGTTASAGAEPYTVADGAASAGPAGGLTPAQLALAYGYEPSAGGQGQTLALVDAFDDPNIEADLATFDREYGLSACESADGCFEKVAQNGSATALPPQDRAGWSLEIALDAEIAHAACASCRILLVEAQNASFTNLAAATDEAVALGANEVSNSYGGPETGLPSTAVAAYEHPGVVITAATGDHGYDGWDLIDELVSGEGGLDFGEGSEMPNAPASLASVVAVGGTTLTLNPDGTRAGERVWDGDGPGDQLGLSAGAAKDATGGGCSSRFDAPTWQEHAPGFAATGCGPSRLDADISIDGDPLSGFDVYDSYRCGSYCSEREIGRGWLTTGGTSLGAPLIAALYALAGGSGGVPYPALTPYAHLGDASALFDVSAGSNGFCGGETLAQCGDPNASFGHVDCEGTSACNAAVGFDGPSGVGTPNGLGAFRALLPTPVISAPGALGVGVAASFSAALSSDPYGGEAIVGYSWNWGDGTPVVGGVSATHVFSAPGTYAVTLTVTDSYGVSASSTAALTVVAAPTPLAAAGRGSAAFRAHRPAVLAHLASTRLQASASGVVSVEIGCPTGSSGCAGTVTLSRPSGLRVALASRAFAIAAGTKRRLTLRLSHRALVLLARQRRLRVRVAIRGHSASGVAQTSRTLLMLLASCEKRNAPRCS
jgi:PKD domain-containing protein